MTDRPPLGPDLSGSELRRWYWTMAELQPFARSLKVSASGPKADLIARLAAKLDEEPVPVAARRPRASKQLEGDLDLDTVIPPGQRSTRRLREFFEVHVGSAFRFDGHMRKFLADAGDATLGDAVEHWHLTRGQALPTQPASLEFNRFTKQWHRAHPAGTATECRQAWMRYRSLPVDERPSVEDA